MYRDLFFFNYTATTEIYTYCHTLSLHDALPISPAAEPAPIAQADVVEASTEPAQPRFFPPGRAQAPAIALVQRSEEHTSELQSLMRISYAVFCLKKKNTSSNNNTSYTYDTCRLHTAHRHMRL